MEHPSSTKPVHLGPVLIAHLRPCASGPSLMTSKSHWAKQLRRLGYIQKADTQDVKGYILWVITEAGREALGGLK